MPRNKDFKKHVRARMSETGEHYTQAREKLSGKPEREGLHSVRGWSLSGSHPIDYEIGLEKAQTFEGSPGGLSPVRDQANLGFRHNHADDHRRRVPRQASAVFRRGQG